MLTSSEYYKLMGLIVTYADDHAEWIKYSESFWHGPMGKKTIEAEVKLAKSTTDLDVYLFGLLLPPKTTGEKE